MGEIIIENNCFYFCPGKNKARSLLLDCSAYIENNSRIPLYTSDGSMSIPNLLLALLKAHPGLSKGARSEDDSQEMLMLDLILIKKLMEYPKKLNVLEIGCTDGIVSYHLATIMGIFNQESHLCCVSNVMGNDSGNNWIDYISGVDALPRLTFAASDYDDILLQEKLFDLVFINGTCFFEESLPVIRQAARLAKEEGKVVCYSNSQPLLDSSFMLCYSSRREYNFRPCTSVYISDTPGNIWDGVKPY